MMNNKPLIMLFAAAMTISACSDNKEQKDNNEPIISKAILKIDDGKLTPAIMHQMGKVSDPQVSPDGKEILYGVTYTSIEQNKSNRELMLMNIDGSNVRQITISAASEQNARWFNNGSEILFLRGGQIWLMDKDGSNERKVSDHTAGISEFKLSPKGDKIMFSSSIPYGNLNSEKFPELPKADGRLITNLMYRHWDCFVEETPRTYIADFDGKTISNTIDILGDEPFELPTLPFGGLDQLDWSPDQTQLLYSCRKLVGKEYAFSTNTDIYRYDINSKKAENLTEGMMGYDTDPLYSPDGSKCAWISMERNGFEADKRRLFIMEMATKEKQELTTNYAYNIETITWKPDGTGLYFTSCVNALTGIYEINIADKAVKKVAEDQYDFGGVQVAGDKLIGLYQSMSMPNEIVATNISDGKFTQLSFENKEILDQITMGKTVAKWIKTVDNKNMHEWIVYPPNFDSTKVYPVILFCTGGPQGVLSQSWSTRWNFQLMAAQGYIVLLPNRRGTTAFGQEWTDQISGDYIGLNMQDYLSSVKDIKKEKYAGKIGAAGASYGGYSIYYLAGIHKGLFSAFIAHAGIFNQEQMYMMTEELWFPNWDNGGAPWDDNPIAKRHYSNSPHKLIKNWDTPILVTHGELDYRVPVEQGMAAFNAAQMMGVPSEMLLFPDENHWILKPQNSLQWNKVFFEWFDKWLKTE